MYQGMAQQYLMDPTGGNDIYDNALASWGVLGMDIGLTMFGKSISNAIGKNAIGQHHKASVNVLRNKHSLISRFGTPGQQKMVGALSQPYGKRGAMGKQRIRTLRTKAKLEFVKESKGLVSKYKSYGRFIRGLGAITAAVGLFDVGFSMLNEMSSPGISRENLDRDRQQVFSDEGMLDTRMAYTQRQRAIQAIHDSQLSVGRAIIGAEATYLHR